MDVGRKRNLAVRLECGARISGQDPDDTLALRAGIDHMLDHHGDYPRELIRERATSRYSLDAIGDTWTAVYRSVRGHG